MGGSSSKSEGIEKAQNHNGKTIKILAQICSKWGYGGKVNAVKAYVIKALADKGYEVHYDFEPRTQIVGEYFIYLIKDDTKKLIYSNNSNLHKDEALVFGKNISQKNGEEIVYAIIANC